ncbi:MAG: hypothetical protein WC222_06625 [Parachlamydiales bacterium]|jgi:hypothetical protein
MPFLVDSEQLEQQLRALIDTFVQNIKKTAVHHFLWLNGMYVLTALLGVALIASLTVWVSPLFTALTLSTFLLSFVAGYILRRYIHLHKADDYILLVEQFGLSCHQALENKFPKEEFHATLGLAYAIFSDCLQDIEYNFFSPKFLPKSLTSLAENISCFFFQHDLFLAREVLLQASLSEYLQLVKTDPINLTYHSQLANGYVLLSRLYKNPQEENQEEERRWIDRRIYTEEISKKYRRATERAIEEFKIISSYAPDDPWVLAQLALSYKDLKLPLEEIHTCEALLRLSPSDRETLHRLGTLYFQLGANAKGLEVYRQLCHIDCAIAASLITYYGSH